MQSSLIDLEELKNSYSVIFQAAEEIDPGYIEVQSMLSRILLAGSIVGLIATIGLILPG